MKVHTAITAISSLILAFTLGVLAPSLAHAQKRIVTERLVNRNSGRCLDAHGWDPPGTAGGRVQTFECNGSPNQLWDVMFFEDDGSSGAVIRNHYSGTCLDNPATGNLPNGSGFYLWPCHYGPQQRWWQLHATGGISLAPKNASFETHDFLMIDENPFSLGQVYLWGANGGTPQQWANQVMSIVDLQPPSSVSPPPTQPAPPAVPAPAPPMVTFGAHFQEFSCSCYDGRVFAYNACLVDATKYSTINAQCGLDCCGGDCAAAKNGWASWLGLQSVECGYPMLR